MFVEKTTQSLPIGSFCGVRNHEFSSAEMIWERGELFGRRVWAMLSGVVGQSEPGRRDEKQHSNLSFVTGPCAPKDSAGIKLHFPEARDDIHHKRSLDIAESRFRRVGSLCPASMTALAHLDDALHHSGLKCRPAQFRKMCSLWSGSFTMGRLTR